MSDSTRKKIIKDFAEWAAFSATRSGCPVKSRDAVYPLIQLPKYEEIIEGKEEITEEEFNKWHKNATEMIISKNKKLPVGWATKLINVYLKVRVYLAGEGRPGLVKWIHPPIDNGLWDGIKNKYENYTEIIDKTHIVSRIKDIKRYETYKRIIEGCKLIANKKGCLLIEVEELWEGTKYIE